MHRPVRLAAVLALAGSAAGHCPTGDIDLDGSVGVGDFLAVLGNWGPCPDPPAPCLADLDHDGEIGIGDFLIVLGNWGPTLIVGGTHPALYINGADCATEPDLQVHAYNDDTYIIRQSLCTNFEGPFMYMLFGSERVLLFDTGTVGIALAPTIYGIIDEWLARNNRGSIELIVAHSHGHPDHTGNDGEFNNQPNTTVVGINLASVTGFFGFTDWPNDVVEYDLGGRVLEVMAIPGHTPVHLAVYDQQTGLLLSGDSFMAGRLLIFDFPNYLDSVVRLADFAEQNPVCEFLGGHVEMSNTPGLDFAPASNHHPDEHPLPLHPSHLEELHEAILNMQDDPTIEIHDEFIIAPIGAR